MKSDFMGRTAKIIAEIRARTCMDYVDTDVLKEILQDELIKYHNEVFTYGHTIGYDDGYIAGESILNGDVDNAYDEGYSLGHSEGYSEGYSDGRYDSGFKERHS